MIEAAIAAIVIFITTAIYVYDAHIKLRRFKKLTNSFETNRLQTEKLIQEIEDEIEKTAEARQMYMDLCEKSTSSTDEQVHNA